MLRVQPGDIAEPIAVTEVIAGLFLMSLRMRYIGQELRGEHRSAIDSDSQEGLPGDQSQVQAGDPALNREETRQDRQETQDEYLSVLSQEDDGFGDAGRAECLHFE
jgi:hypothetical protein